MADRRPTCRTVDVDGQAVRVRGVGPPTEHDLAIIRDFAALLRQRAQETTMPTTASCKSCSKDIVWATLPDGKLIPLDAKPVVDGNLAARRDERGDLVVRYLKAGEQPADGEHRGITHFATCPNAGQHRRRG